MGMEKREEESEEQTQNGKIGRADHRWQISTVSSCLRLDSFTTSNALNFSGEEKWGKEDKRWKSKAKRGCVMLWEWRVLCLKRKANETKQ